SGTGGSGSASSSASSKKRAMSAHENSRELARTRSKCCEGAAVSAAAQPGSAATCLFVPVAQDMFFGAGAAGADLSDWTCRELAAGAGAVDRAALARAGDLAVVCRVLVPTRTDVGFAEACAESRVVAAGGLAAAGGASRAASRAAHTNSDGRADICRTLRA